MKIYEIAGFKDAETGMPSYDDVYKDPEYFARAKRKKAGVVLMDPKEYIRKSVEGFKKQHPDITTDSLIKSRDSVIVDEYAQAMKDGAEFPTLMLSYAMGFSQEGLHRAMAAIKLGLKEVPVMIISSTRKKDRGKLKPTY